jgi:hypothetical protein
MKLRVCFILVICTGFLFLNTNFIIAEMTETEEEATIAPEPIKITEQITNSPEAEAQWIWGEVVIADSQKGEILVKYLDYDADQEKEMAINVDEKTIYENVKSIDEIKPQDTVSIDYIVSPEGKNIAKNISIEKIEEQAAGTEAEVSSEKALEAGSTTSVPLQLQE